MSDQSNETAEWFDAIRRAGRKTRSEATMSKALSESIDTTDAGKAANVAARAAILFAKVSGMNAANTMRERQGYALAYGDEMFEEAIADCFPEAS